MSFDRSKYLAGVARMPRPADPVATTELTLPSGVTVRVERPDLGAWFVSGRLPQGLSLVSFQRFLQGETPAAEIQPECIDAVAEFMRDMIVSALIEPRIVPDAVALEPGELHYRDLGAEDASFLFGWVTRSEEVARLATFRGDAGVRDVGGRGVAVRNQAKRARRDRGPGAGA